MESNMRRVIRTISFGFEKYILHTDEVHVLRLHLVFGGVVELNVSHKSKRVKKKNHNIVARTMTR